jgi:hypothetical protein
LFLHLNTRRKNREGAFLQRNIWYLKDENKVWAAIEAVFGEFEQSPLAYGKMEPDRIVSIWTERGTTIGKHEI